MPFSLSAAALGGLKRRTAALVLVLLGSGAHVAAESSCSGKHWVDIWGSMPQLVEPANLPNAPYNGSDSVFQNATLRQTVYITHDAPTIRLEFSNAFGLTDLPITAATIAHPLTSPGGAGSSAILPSSLQPITFSGGQPSFVIPPGALAVSDPLSFVVKAQSVVTVTLYLSTGQQGHAITGHPGSRTTTFLTPGDLSTAPDLPLSPPTTTQKTDHWYFLSSISGYLPRSHSSLAILGDSLTDGRGSTTNGNNRWPDQLLARLPPSSPRAVINQAAGGNRLLHDGLGPSTLSRLDRDVLARPGVRYTLLLIGINDIGTATASEIPLVANQLIAGYTQLVARLHGRGIAAVGGTLMPMTGPGQVYGADPAREGQRLRVNEWIRTSGVFDAVVDFDAAVRSAENATVLDARFDGGDHLHLNADGYRAMAGAVDLSLFERLRGGVWKMV
ncbi:SGNH hydrolase-type esterase domain-containing protein [Podospora appendiculata]|uniref:SGNH hydrolase-type esterase domain-containing protein n=1 Tax=Podospora appendiculata TaxID=314037 RepID=A0AAE1CI99_9PEZI|nr:SGNH hydrolase-type esterase domain-containing protein [Podospora appendiculata]